MPSIAAVLKYEIRRLARKEVRTAVLPLRSEKVALKRKTRELSLRLAQIERTVKLMAADVKRRGVLHAAPVEKDARVRITAKGVRSLRRKLGLTQEEFGKLLSVTTQAVYQWEHKQGPLRLREKPRRAYLAARHLGAREAKWRLEQMAG